MATTPPKHHSPCSHCLSKNKKYFRILLATLTFILVAAFNVYEVYHWLGQLNHGILRLQSSVDQLHDQINQLNDKSDAKTSKLEEPWKDSEAKLSHQEEVTQKLEDDLKQQSLHSEIREAHQVQEMKTQKEMDLQAQQKIDSSDQQVLSLNQELKAYKRANQFMRQEQTKIKSEDQELLTQRPPEALPKSEQSHVKELETLPDQNQKENNPKESQRQTEQDLQQRGAVPPLRRNVPQKDEFEEAHEEQTLDQDEGGWKIHENVKSLIIGAVIVSLLAFLVSGVWNYLSF